jgi:hypothetical protein
MHIQAKGLREPLLAAAASSPPPDVTVTNTSPASIDWNAPSEAAVTEGKNQSSSSSKWYFLVFRAAPVNSPNSDLR